LFGSKAVFQAQENLIFINHTRSVGRFILNFRSAGLLVGTVWIWVVRE